MKSSNLGYPRIGDDREWKKALEKFWAGKITQEDFLQETRQLSSRIGREQAVTGIFRSKGTVGYTWKTSFDRSLYVESTQHIPLIEAIYARMHTAAPHLKIMLQTNFEAVVWYDQLVQLPVEGIGLDLVHGLHQSGNCPENLDSHWIKSWVQV